MAGADEDDALVAEQIDFYRCDAAVLEIAAGTGRIAALYLPHATHAVLLDASPESLAIAAGRLGADPCVTFVDADVFAWEPGTTFDTIVFAAWLHHVSRSRFAAFWSQVQTLLASGGRVIFEGLFENAVWAEATR